MTFTVATLSPSNSWLYSETRVVVLIDCRRNNLFWSPYLHATLESVLSSLAAGPDTPEATADFRPMVHVTVALSAREGFPLRILIQGWRLLCGGPVEPLRRLLDEQICLALGAEMTEGATPTESACGLRSCVRDGLLCLAVLPASAVPALTILTDAISSPVDSPLLALRQLDVTLLLLICLDSLPSEHQSDTEAHRYGRGDSLLGLAPDTEGHQRAAQLSSGLMLQLHTASDGTTAPLCHSCLASALMLRTPVSQLVADEHASWLAQLVPPSWLLSPRPPHAQLSRVATSNLSHRERLHMYDVPASVVVGDLFRARMLEGFRLVDTTALAEGVQGVGESPTPRSPTRAKTLTELKVELRRGIVIGDVVLRVGCAWGNATSIEYVVRALPLVPGQNRRSVTRCTSLNPNIPLPGAAKPVQPQLPRLLPTSPSEQALRAHGRLDENSGPGTARKSTSVAPGAANGADLEGGSSGSFEHSSQRTLRVYVSVTAPLTFWLRFEQARVQRRRRQVPDRSDASALQAFVESVRHRDRRLARLADAVSGGKREWAAAFQVGALADHVLLQRLEPEISLLPIGFPTAQIIASLNSWNAQSVTRLSCAGVAAASGAPRTPRTPGTAGAIVATAARATRGNVATSVRLSITADGGCSAARSAANSALRPAILQALSPCFASIDVFARVWWASHHGLPQTPRRRFIGSSGGRYYLCSGAADISRMGTEERCAPFALLVRMNAAPSGRVIIGARAFRGDAATARAVLFDVCGEVRARCANLVARSFVWRRSDELYSCISSSLPTFVSPSGAEPNDLPTEKARPQPAKCALPAFLGNSPTPAVEPGPSRTLGSIAEVLAVTVVGTEASALGTSTTLPTGDEAEDADAADKGEGKAEHRNDKLPWLAFSRLSVSRAPCTHTHAWQLRWCWRLPSVQAAQQLLQKLVAARRAEGWWCEDPENTRGAALLNHAIPLFFGSTAASDTCVLGSAAAPDTSMNWFGPSVGFKPAAAAKQALVHYSVLLVRAAVVVTLWQEPQHGVVQVKESVNDSNDVRCPRRLHQNARRANDLLDFPNERVPPVEECPTEIAPASGGSGTAKYLSTAGCFVHVARWLAWCDGHLASAVSAVVSENIAEPPCMQRRPMGSDSRYRSAVSLQVSALPAQHLLPHGVYCHWGVRQFEPSLAGSSHTRVTHGMTPLTSINALGMTATSETGVEANPMAPTGLSPSKTTSKAVVPDADDDRHFEAPLMRNDLILTRLMNMLQATCDGALCFSHLHPRMGTAVAPVALAKLQPLSERGDQLQEGLARPEACVVLRAEAPGLVGLAWLSASAQPAVTRSSLAAKPLRTRLLEQLAAPLTGPSCNTCNATAPAKLTAHFCVCGIRDVFPPPLTDPLLKRLFACGVPRSPRLDGRSGSLPSPPIQGVPAGGGMSPLERGPMTAHMGVVDAASAVRAAMSIRIGLGTTPGTLRPAALVSLAPIDHHEHATHRAGAQYRRTHTLCSGTPRHIACACVDRLIARFSARLGACINPACVSALYENLRLGVTVSSADASFCLDSCERTEVARVTLDVALREPDAPRSLATGLFSALQLHFTSVRTQRSATQRASSSAGPSSKSFSTDCFYSEEAEPIFLQLTLRGTATPTCAARASHSSGPRSSLNRALGSAHHRHIAQDSLILALEQAAAAAGTWSGFGSCSPPLPPRGITVGRESPARKLDTRLSFSDPLKQSNATKGPCMKRSLYEPRTPQTASTAPAGLYESSGSAVQLVISALRPREVGAAVSDSRNDGEAAVKSIIQRLRELSAAVSLSALRSHYSLTPSTISFVRSHLPLLSSAERIEHTITLRTVHEAVPLLVAELAQLYIPRASLQLVPIGEDLVGVRLVPDCAPVGQIRNAPRLRAYSMRTVGGRVLDCPRLLPRSEQFAASQVGQCLGQRQPLSCFPTHLLCESPIQLPILSSADHWAAKPMLREGVNASGLLGRLVPLDYWLLLRLAATCTPPPAAVPEGRGCYHELPCRTGSWTTTGSSPAVPPIATEGIRHIEGNAHEPGTLTELHISVGGLLQTRAREVASMLERAVREAAGRATKRLLLGHVHESRSLDTRLLPGGAHECEPVMIETLEIHERLRSDSRAALAASCDALQPLAISGVSNLFVYRTAGSPTSSVQRDVFLLSLSLVELGTDGATSPVPMPVATSRLSTPTPEPSMTSESVISGPPTPATSDYVACVQLTVYGVTAPSDEISVGLLGHLHDKLEELTLLRFSTLLPRITHTRLAAADLRFLRPPGAPPLAAAVLSLPSSLISWSLTPSAPLLAWGNWLKGCSSWLRASGWCPLNHGSTPGSASEVLSLLHVPLSRMGVAFATSGLRVAADRLAPKALICAFLSLQHDVTHEDPVASFECCETIEHAREPDRTRLRVVGDEGWSLRLRVWGRWSAGGSGVGPVSGATSTHGSAWRTSNFVNKAASQLLEGLCALLCSRMIEEDVLQTLRTRSLAIATRQSGPAPSKPFRILGTALLEPLYGPAQAPNILIAGFESAAPSPACSEPESSQTFSSRKIPTAPPDSVQYSTPHAGTGIDLLRATAAICDACAVSSNAVARIVSPLAFPDWTLRKAAALIYGALSELSGGIFLTPMLVTALNDGKAGRVSPSQAHVEGGKQLLPDSTAAGPTTLAASCSILAAMSLPPSHVSPTRGGADGAVGAVASPSLSIHFHLGDRCCCCTYFSRFPDGSVGSVSESDPGGQLPDVVGPLLLALDMHSRLVDHTAHLVKKSHENEWSHAFDQAGVVPEASAVACLHARSQSPRANQVGRRRTLGVTNNHPIAAASDAVCRDPLGPIPDGQPMRMPSLIDDVIAQSSRATLAAGQLLCAVEASLPICPILYTWRHPMLLVTPSSHPASLVDGGGTPHNPLTPKLTYNHCCDSTAGSLCTRLVAWLARQLPEVTKNVWLCANRTVSDRTVSSTLLCSNTTEPTVPMGAAKVVLVRQAEVVFALRLSPKAGTGCHGAQCAIHVIGSVRPAFNGRRLRAFTDELPPRAAADVVKAPSDDVSHALLAKAEASIEVASRHWADTEVGSALAALHYDFHVAQAAPSSSIGSEISSSAVDSVASLRALCTTYISQPSLAACRVLDGEACSPPISISQLSAYMGYLAPVDLAGILALNRWRGVGPWASELDVLYFRSCGCPGALSFVLPPPLDRFECVAWPTAATAGSPTETVLTRGRPSLWPDKGGACTATEMKEPPWESRFLFFLLGVSGLVLGSPVSHSLYGELTQAVAEIEPSCVRDEASRLLERALRCWFEAFRCYCVWSSLQSGSLPVLTDLDLLLRALPVLVELDEPFPSLRSLMHLSLPWAGLVRGLTTLPFRCRLWTEPSDSSDHLVLLRPDETNRGGSVGVPQLQPQQQLVHCRLDATGTALRLTAYCTLPLRGQPEFPSELCACVADAVICWVWTMQTTEGTKGIDSPR